MIKAQKKNKELAPLFASKKNTETKAKETNNASNPVRANIAQLKSTPPPTSNTAPKAMTQFGVSLKSLTQKDEKNTKSEDVEKIDKSLKTPFSLENLQKAWIEYTDTIDFDKHYKNALVNSIPKEIENNTFEILSDNQMQADKLDGERVKVLNFLRKNLQNYSIEMTIRVDVNNEQRIAFTSVDKYKLMIEENESLKLLKERLNLELL